MLEARIILKPSESRSSRSAARGWRSRTTPSEVAAYSAREAARRYGRALIVEDAGLFVEALGGFPGPFSSYAFKTIGIEGLLTLLGGRRSRKASFRSAVAYCEPGGEPRVFEGEVLGR